MRPRNVDDPYWSVRLGDGVYLALGYYRDAFDLGCGGSLGAWLSPDGLVWERSSEPLGCGNVGGLLPLARGALGLGSTEDAAGTVRPMGWLTVDATSWERIAMPFDTVATPLGVAPDGTLLAFTEGTVWESIDGRTWLSSVRAPAKDAAFGGDVAILSDDQLGMTALKLAP